MIMLLLSFIIIIIIVIIIIIIIPSMTYRRLEVDPRAAGARLALHIVQRGGVTLSFTFCYGSR